MSAVFGPTAGRLYGEGPLIVALDPAYKLGLTFAFWMKWVDFPPPIGCFPFTLQNDSAELLSGYIRVDSSSTGEFFMKHAFYDNTVPSSVRRQVALPTFMTDSDWHMFVVQINEGTDRPIYITSDFDRVGASTGNSCNVPASGNNTIFHVNGEVDYFYGFLKGPSESNFKVGSIAVWERGLTALERDALFDGANPETIANGLYEHWDFTTYAGGTITGNIKSISLSEFEGTVGFDAGDNPPFAGPLPPVVSDVNGNNTITSLGPVVINGQFQETITGVTLGGETLTIDSSGQNQVTCLPFDAHSTALPFGNHNLVVDDGTNQDSIQVELNPVAGMQLVTGANVDTTYGLAQAGGTNGDQWETGEGEGESSIGLLPDTNMVITPAVPEGYSQAFWRYSAGSWTEDSFSVTGSNLQVSIDNVNGDDLVRSLGTIVINGSFPYPITSATLGGVSLSIDSQTTSVVACLPIDVHTTSLPYGEHQLFLSDGTYDDTIAVQLAPQEQNQYKVMSGLISEGILKDVAGAADGDQVEILKYYNSIVLDLSENGDVRFYPKMPNQTILTRWWFNGSVWDSGTITIFQGAFDEVSWIGTPSPPPSVPGQPYSYSLSSLIVGDRPVELSVTKGRLPIGLALNSETEAIEGTTAETGVFPDVEITASNEVAKSVIEVLGG